MSVLNLLIPSIGSGGRWSDEYFAVSWGIYIGEYCLVAIWIAWGSGDFYQRVAGGVLLGATWITFSWLGSSIGQDGTGAIAYTDELLRERLIEELFWAALFAAYLSTFALITCPLIVSGILKPRMRLSHILLAALLATVYEIALAWGSALMFPLPGPGGAAANIVGITILLGLASVGFVIAGAIFWRTIGYRLHSGRLLLGRPTSSTSRNGTAVSPGDLST